MTHPASTPFLANDIPIDELTFQRSALNPERSVIIEACAGSGKTWLLVSRILRILLQGMAPHQILALTFTRKAAQEMQARLLEELELWATAEDQYVIDSLQQKALAASEAKQQLAYARTLYEKILNGSQNVTIDTFHGWFARILRYAPLSSGLGTNFALIEHTGRWMDQAWQDFSLRLQQKKWYLHRIAFAQLIQLVGAAQTKKILFDFLHRRVEWWMYCMGTSNNKQQAGIQHTKEILRDQAKQAGIVLQDQHPFPLVLAPDMLEKLEKINTILVNQKESRKTGKQIIELSHKLNQWLQLFIDITSKLLKEGNFMELYEIFFTQQNTPRAILTGAWTKALDATIHDTYLNLLENVCSFLKQVYLTLIEWNTLHLNQAGLLCGGLLIECYQQIKTDLGSIDFNDLEWQLHQLLNYSEHTAYIQTRLDARYHQILIDEFQDTNPLQWSILNAWLDAYSGAAKRPQIFIVGDPKQSIYRFRRAEPRLFAEVARQLQQTHAALWLRTNRTRRNSQAIITVLNTVMQQNPLFQTQKTICKETGGFTLVPILPTQTSEHSTTVSETSTWRDVLTTPRSEDERNERYQEGRYVADQIRQLLPRLTINENGLTRLATYSDVMILIPRRSHLIEYERALRDAGLPFISDRSGGLLNALESGDLKSLLNWLSAPYRNLALAQILRSPIFGWSDEDLYLLAQHTKKNNWWSTLQYLAQQSIASPLIQHTTTKLTDWLHYAGILPVHDLLDHIYDTGQILERYTARSPNSLVAQVQANLYEFIALALSIDAGRYPSLPAFLDELKRLEQAHEQETPDEGNTAAGYDAARILTIHGAKGLEAPLVVMMDSTATMREDHSGVLVEWHATMPRPTHFSLYLPKKQRGSVQQQWFDAEEALEIQENWNLLYVALTRAQQWLIISATQTRKNGHSEDWYQRMQAANQFSTPILANPSTTLLHPPSCPLIDFHPTPVHVGKYTAKIDLPHTRLGKAWHALIEQASLTQMHTPFPEANMLAQQFDLTLEAAKQAIHAAQIVLNAPGLARFFDPQQYQQARNEMDIITNEGALKRLDRWVLFAHECWILDYKWQVTFEEYDSYRKQLTTYAHALEPYSGARPLRCGLITHQAELIEILPF